MATDNRKIQIETEVVANTDALQKVEADFKKVADEAVRSGQKASQGLERMGEGADNASDKVGRSTKSIIAAVQRTTIAMETGGRTTAEYYKLLAQQRGADPAQLEPYLQKLREIEVAQRAAGTGLQQAGRQLDQFGNTAKATAAALRQVPAQFTDIVVSLQGGQAPLTVLLQQGGQLRDVFGSAGAAAQALGGYILSLVNPFTVLAAAVGGVAVAYELGRKEAAEFSKTLILTGNAAGTSATQLSALAARIDGVIGTQSKAAEVLNLLAQSGNVGAASFERLTVAAIAFERAGGGAVEDVVKNFSNLGKDPLTATLRLNEGMNYLTKSTLEQITALEQQGRAIEAAKVAQDAYAAALERATPQLVQNLGYVERAWGGVKDAAKETADFILGIGRATTPEDTLGKLRTQLTNAEALRSAAQARGQNVSGESPDLTTLREQIALLEKGVTAAKQRAQAERDTGLAVKQLADFQKDSLKYQSDEAKFAAAKLEIQNKYSLAVREGYVTEQQLLAMIEAKRKEIFKAEKASVDTQLGSLRGRVQAEQQQLDLLRSQGSQADKLTEGAKLALQYEQQLKMATTERERVRFNLLLVASKELDAVQQQVAAEKELVKVIEDGNKAYEQSIVKLRDEAAAILAQAVSQEAVATASGKSRTAIAESNLALLEQQRLVASGDTRILQGLDSKIEAQKRLVAAIKATDYKEVNDRSTEFLRISKEQEALYESELQLSGLTALERAKIVAQRQIELKYATEIAKIEKSSLTDAQKAAQIQILDEAKFRETSAAVNKVIQADFARTSEQISQSLTDALMRGFESGKDFAQNLKDTVINMFKTMVLRPVVQAIVNPLALTLTSALGMSGSAQAAQGGANMLGGVSGVTSAFNMLNTGVSTAIADGFGKLASSSFGQSIGLTTPIAGPVSASGQAATQLTSTGQSLSAGLGMAGNALAGYGIQKAISGGYKTGESGIVDAITLAASAYFGPIAGVAAGVFNRAFGRKLVDSGVLGSFGGEQGFQGSQFTFEKGGFFRSDRERTSALDVGFESSLSNQFRALQTQTALLADSLGLGVDSIANFTKDVRLSFRGLTEEQIATKITEEFEAIGESLAELALGTTDYTRIGESATQTLSRLSTSILSVNSAFDVLGYKLYETSLQGAAAASNLTDLFGGVEAFKQAAASYYESFYTDAEQLDIATRQITKSLKDLGLAFPVDKLAYRLEVERALAQGNEELFASLVKLAPAFAQVMSGMDAMREAAAKLAEEQAKAAAKLAEEASKAAAEAAKIAAETARQIRLAVLEENRQSYANAVSETDKAFSAFARSVAAAAEDAQQALTSAYERTVENINAQQQAVRASQQIATENLRVVSGLFNLLKDEIEGLVEAAGAGMTATQGRAFIAQALATAQITGYLPEQESLGGAIDAVTKTLTESQYATAFELKRDRLLLANQLTELQDITGDQKTTAEKQLDAAEEQLKLLDEQLKAAKEQYDDASKVNKAFYDDMLQNGQEQVNAMRDVDTSVKDLATAITTLAAAVAIEKQAGNAPGSKTNVGPSGYTSAEIENAARDIQESVRSGGGSWDAADRAIGEAAIAAGVSSGELANALGVPVSVVLERAEELGLPRFQKGGYYSGGMALVGEQGPELINFRNPGMVYNAEQTGTMLGSSVALVDEVRALREDNQAQARAMVQIQARLTKLMERWDSNGLPETRAVA